MSTKFYALINQCSHCGRNDDMHIGTSAASTFTVHEQVLWASSKDPAILESFKIDSWESLVEFLCTVSSVTLIDDTGDHWSVDDFVERFDKSSKTPRA